MEALIFQRAICLAVGYVFGMFQTGYIVGRVMHVDIRKKGSGNAGSTNAVRVLGWKAGAVTFFGDVLKCILAVLLMRFVFRESDCLPLLVVYTGMGVTLGHNFLFYLKFKGGKGMAVLGALVLMTAPCLVPIPLISFLIVVIFTRYVSLGSILAAAIYFMEVVFYGCMGGFGMELRYEVELYILAGLIMILAWVRHKDNIKRLLAGKENRFGVKKAE